MRKIIGPPLVAGMATLGRLDFADPAAQAPDNRHSSKSFFASRPARAGLQAATVKTACT